MNRSGRPPRPQKVIAVDVDNTLIDAQGKLNQSLVNWLADNTDGYEAYLWSARGKDYAKAVAFKHRVDKLFSNYVSKPGYIFDDMGWSWARQSVSLNKLVKGIRRSTRGLTNNN